MSFCAKVLGCVLRYWPYGLLAWVLWGLWQAASVLP